MTYIDVPHESNLCGAHARTTGMPCRKYAMTNGRCKLHGGKTPIKHGMYTKEALELRRQYAELLRDSRSLMTEYEASS
jgi:hypothetical protein